MKRALIVLATVAMIGSAIVPDPAHAGGRGVAAGVVGGLAVGALLGAAIASPRPGPVYVEEPVYYHRPPPPRCYWTRGEPEWDGYRGVWRRPRVQVCD